MVPRSENRMCMYRPPFSKTDTPSSCVTVHPVRSAEVTHSSFGVIDCPLIVRAAKTLYRGAPCAMRRWLLVSTRRCCRLSRQARGTVGC